MPDDPQRKLLVERMVAEGTSDDDIRATLQAYDSKPRSAWTNMGHRVAGVKQGVNDTLGLSNMVDAGKLTGDITKQKAAAGYKGFGGTLADNFQTFKDVSSGALGAVGGMVSGAGQLVGKLAKAMPGLGPVPGNVDPKAMQELVGAVDPGGSDPNQDPIEKRWRRGTNLAGLVVLNKGLPWSKEADAARKAAEVSKAWDEAHAIQMMTGAASIPGVRQVEEMKQVAQGLGGPPPKVVPPKGGVTAVEQLAQALRDGSAEGSAALQEPGVHKAASLGGVELPPPQFSLGARQPPEQPRWQLLPKEMLEAGEGAPGGPVYGPKANTVTPAAKLPTSKTAVEQYAGPERRGPNRMANPIEDAAYAQVRKAQARKAALGRAQAMLGGSEGKGTLAQTASNIETELAAGHTAPGDPNKVVSLPVATPEEAAPALAPVSDLQTKVKAWQDKWKSLTGKARRDLEGNIPTDVKQAMEDQLNRQGNPAPGIRKALGMGPLKKPTLVKPAGAGAPPVGAVGVGAVSPIAEVPAGAGMVEPPAGAGFSKGKTLTLQDMVDKYGLETAAQRAGMSPTELRARIAAGKDPDKLATLLRGELGADATARTLGVSPDSVRESAGNTPSRLPKQAVDRLKAAADKEIAETGQMSQRTAEGLARAQREEQTHGPFTAFGGVPDLTGFVKEHPVMAGAAAGGALGYGMSDDGDDSNISLAKALTGAAGGAGVMAAATNLPAFLHGAMGLRREGFLSGGAIPKNIMTAAGAPLHLATDVGVKEGWNATKEMFNLPKNVETFMDSLRNPVQNDYNASTGRHFGMLAPSNVIGAIDATATKALQRAGISKDDIQRVLLTKERDMLGPDTSKTAREASRFLLPFQRVPWNVFKESLEEMGHMWGDLKTAHTNISGVVKGELPLSAAKKAIPSLRTAADLGALASGYALGEWAGNDPKKKYVLSILLAAYGPRQAFGIMGAVAGLGTQGLAAGAVGGISPIPEQAFDLKATLGMKPAALSAYEKLSGNKITY